MTPDEKETAARRMQILRALSLHVGHTAMPGALKDELAATGYAMTLTKLMLDCAFLAELGLVSAPEAGSIALTSDGLDMVNGLVRLPGLSPAPLLDPPVI
ncbi:MAG: hypothetical protein LBJ59_08145 [Zoogloeaceae bacterium]|jgi:hypothetical protein|nr:hypothetical protein [Zoogloeaceae bacterium]